MAECIFGADQVVVEQSENPIGEDLSANMGAELAGNLRLLKYSMESPPRLSAANGVTAFPALK